MVTPDLDAYDSARMSGIAVTRPADAGEVERVVRSRAEAAALFDDARTRLRLQNAVMDDDTYAVAIEAIRSLSTPPAQSGDGVEHGGPDGYATNGFVAEPRCPDCGAQVDERWNCCKVFTPDTSKEGADVREAVKRIITDHVIASLRAAGYPPLATRHPGPAADAIIAALRASQPPEQAGEVLVPDALKRSSERATPGPWSWEQCGDKGDDPVVGIIFPADDPDCARPYSGEVRDGADNDYRITIALEWPYCDGHPGSANADFAVAAVNFVRSLLTAAQAGTEK